VFDSVLSAEVERLQSTPMKLLLVEDQLMFREAIRQTCERDLGHEVVGECGTGAEAIRLTQTLQPDVLLLDLSLPDIDGLTVVERLNRARLFPKVLAVSSHCDDYTLFRVEKSGITGFVDKNANSPAVLGEALQALAAGRCYYSAVFQSVREARRRNPRSFTKVLTEWELEILALIGLALSDDEIAARLDLSPRTVQTHRSNILRKLDLPNTPKLIRFAVDNGFTAIAVPLSPPIER
jgi:DNA-binding NarL/FixJ family response regulator